MNTDADRWALAALMALRIRAQRQAAVWAARAEAVERMAAAAEWGESAGYTVETARYTDDSGRKRVLVPNVR